jgi:hypothetical protein
MDVSAKQVKDSSGHTPKRAIYEISISSWWRNLLRNGEDLRVSQNDSSPTSILNRELCLSVLTGNTSDCPGKVIPMQRLDILYFERVEIQVF